MKDFIKTLIKHKVLTTFPSVVPNNVLIFKKLGIPLFIFKYKFQIFFILLHTTKKYFLRYNSRGLSKDVNIHINVKSTHVVNEIQNKRKPETKTNRKIN